MTEILDAVTTHWRPDPVSQNREEMRAFVVTIRLGFRHACASRVLSASRREASHV